MRRAGTCLVVALAACSGGSTDPSLFGAQPHAHAPVPAGYDLAIVLPTSMKEFSAAGIMISADRTGQSESSLVQDLVAHNRSYRFARATKLRDGLEVRATSVRKDSDTLTIWWRPLGDLAIQCADFTGGAPDNCFDIQRTADGIYVPLHLPAGGSLPMFYNGGPKNVSVAINRAGELKPYDLDRTKLGDTLEWRRDLVDGTVTKWHDRHGNFGYVVQRQLGEIDVVWRVDPFFQPDQVERELALCLTFEALSR